MEENIKKIADALDYIIHPVKILGAIWNSIVDISYAVCLTMCIASVLLYVFGFKKCAKLAPFSLALYTLLQAIGKVAL
jgi:hypothetical protein